MVNIVSQKLFKKYLTQTFNSLHFGAYTILHHRNNVCVCVCVYNLTNCLFIKNASKMLEMNI